MKKKTIIEIGSLLVLILAIVLKTSNHAKNIFSPFLSKQKLVFKFAHTS